MPKLSPFADASLSVSAFVIACSLAFTMPLAAYSLIIDAQAKLAKNESALTCLEIMTGTTADGSSHGTEL